MAYTRKAKLSHAVRAKRRNYDIGSDRLCHGESISLLRHGLLFCAQTPYEFSEENDLN